MDRNSETRIAETLVEPEANGLRLDLYLRKRFTYRSRTEWQRSIEEGEILLNGRRTRPSRILQTGEKVAFIPKPAEEPPVDRSFELLEETPDWLAVAKPGNLPCHPAGAFFRNTLWSVLREQYGENIHIATRLDRETSGVVLVARNPETAAAFTRALTGTGVHKRYIAFVHGDFPAELTADGWLPMTPPRRSARNAVSPLNRFPAENARRPHSVFSGAGTDSAKWKFFRARDGCTRSAPRSARSAIRWSATSFTGWMILFSQNSLKTS